MKRRTVTIEIDSDIDINSKGDCMSYGKRGQALELMIEQANRVYRGKGLALVDKVPTPWKVFYNKRTGKVRSAFPEKKSTVDFIGVSHGRSIAFDAKSTKIKTRFDLDLIEPHQMEYLIRHKDQGGISFFIVEFSSLRETYYLEIDKAREWWEKARNGGRKSIPYEWFVVNCPRIRSGHGVSLDYLKYCETVY